MSKRVLITGSQGFVGRYVTAFLLAEFEEIEILGIGRSEKIDNSFTHTLLIQDDQALAAPLPPDITEALQSKKYSYLSVDIMDIRKLGQLLVDFNPTEIIHLASGLKGDGFDKLYNTNVQGTINLLSACNTHLRNIPIIAISSGGVYGFQTKMGDFPFIESDNCKPQDLYQFAKAAEETIVKSFCQHAGIPWIVLRVFNVVGPGQDERHVCGRFVSELLSIKNGWKSPGLQTGPLTSTRDFVDVRDIASVIVNLLKKAKYNETFNVCSGKAVTIQEVLDECLKWVFDGKDDSVSIKAPEKQTTPNIKTDHHLGSNLKVIATGAEFHYDLVASIRDMVSYYDLIYDS